MKYTINYNYKLYGGSTYPERTSHESTPTQDLPIAFSIYEFKSSIGLLPKAIEQNLKNIERCKKGAYKIGDEMKTLKFKTNNETKKVILINDSYDTQFNNLFMEIQYIHRSIDDLIVGRNIKNIKDRIKGHLNNCYNISTNVGYNIYVLDTDNEIRPIQSSLLFEKFTNYKLIFNTVDDTRKFLLDNLKKDPEKNIYIKDFILLRDLERQIQDPKLKVLANQLDLGSKFKFNYKRLYPYIIIRDKYDSDELELDYSQLEILNEIAKNINKIKASDGRTIIEIYDMLIQQKKRSGAIGNFIGNEFEKQVEKTLDLQEKIARTIDDLEPNTYKSYFNFTGGESDVDMTIVIN